HRFSYAGMRGQDRFDLGRRDVLAAPADHFLFTADEVQKALVVEVPEVSRVQPPAPHGASRRARVLAPTRPPPGARAHARARGPRSSGDGGCWSRIEITVGITLKKVTS